MGAKRQAFHFFLRIKLKGRRKYGKSGPKEPQGNTPTAFFFLLALNFFRSECVHEFIDQQIQDELSRDKARMTTCGGGRREYANINICSRRRWLQRSLLRPPLLLPLLSFYFISLMPSRHIFEMLSFAFIRSSDGPGNSVVRVRDALFWSRDKKSDRNGELSSRLPRRFRI